MRLDDGTDTEIYAIVPPNEESKLQMNETIDGGIRNQRSRAQ